MSYPANMYGSSGNDSAVTPDVERWFSAVDRDHSGRISALELKSALANGKGGTFSDNACTLMIGMFDKGNTGTINLPEFQALYNYINAWIGVFKNFDRDSSGTIQEPELSMAFAQMGYSLSPDFIKNLIRKSDPLEQQSITIDQFIVLCVRIQKCTEAFKVRDIDRTGMITIGFEDFLTIVVDTTS